MCKLFYCPRNASWAPHMLLTEMQLNYELIYLVAPVQQKETILKSILDAY